MRSTCNGDLALGGHPWGCYIGILSSWWRHQMETFSALLGICAGNLPVTGEFPAQRPVTRSFDVFFVMRLNKRFSKQWGGWLFETPSLPLWRHSNDTKPQQELARRYDNLIYEYSKFTCLNTIWGTGLTNVWQMWSISCFICHPFYWGLVCQNQGYGAWISYHNTQYTVGCNYITILCRRVTWGKTPIAFLSHVTQ